MRIIIVGGGICGILTAYYALKASPDASVTIIEKREEAGCETSAANASQYGYTDPIPLGKPELFGMLPKLLTGRIPGMGMASHSPYALGWSARLLWHSLPFVHRKDYDRLDALGQKSIARFDEILASTGVAMRDETRDKITLYETRAQRDAYRQKIKDPSRHRFLSDAEIKEYLPGLDVGSPPIAGASITVSGDRVARCAAFCRDMRAFMEKTYPARFSFMPNTCVTGWNKNGRMAVSAITEDGSALGADAFVLCAGPWVNSLLKPLGDSLPVLPVRGHTIAFDCPGASRYIRYPVADFVQRAMYIPLGDTLSVSGIFRFGTCSKERDAADIAYIKRCAFARIPDLMGAAHIVHSGYRPAVPSSYPSVRPSAAPNVIINGGHGMYGWTLSAGTAKEAADAVIAAMA